MGVTGGLGAEAYDRTYGDAELVRRIGAYFRPQARRVLLVAAMVALASLIVTATPLLIARGIDAVETTREGRILLALAALVTVLGVVGWVLNFVRRWFATRAVGDVVLALREDAFRAVMQRDMSFYDQFASGRIVSRVTSDTQDFATVVTLAIELMSQIVVVGVISAVMLVVDWRLALITLSIAPVVVLVSMGFRRLARGAMRRSQRAQAEVNAIVQETVSGISVAKSYRQEAALYADFRSVNELAYSVQLQRAAVFGSIFPLLNTLSGVGTAIVVFFGGLLVIGEQVSVGDWYLFVQSLAIFFYPVGSIASFWSQFQQGLAASERVFALLDAEPRVVQEAQEPVGRLRGRVTFDGVYFSYDADREGDGRERGEQPDERGPAAPSPYVLRDFSLDIPEGQTLALVGHTGAGKSSLIKLILRFYEFQGGRLLVDGRDVRTLDLAQYRRQLGLVPQAPFLFSGTVGENIKFGVPGASDADVERAARHLGDGAWVDDLLHGLDTDVGERGARLSLGQRQLVALSRVLLQDPAILLLDEATASIDPVTETQVQSALATVLGGRTSVVIAHRLSTVRSADRIVVLQHGRILEEGSHAGLLASSGHYAELYETYFRHQSAAYQPDEQRAS